MDVLTRQEWGATSRLGPRMRLPAAESWIHHSVTTVYDDMATCMRQIEQVTVARFGRFAYSYVVHPDGTVAEGAGLTIGAHTANHNSTSFGICHVGNYETRPPTSAQLEGTAALLRDLQGQGALARGVQPTGGHRDTKPTACPGRLLYAQIPAIRRLVATAPSPPVPAPGGALVSALVVAYPPGKIGPLPAAGNRWAYWTHTDRQIRGWNSAALAGDRAEGGSDQDSIEGRCPRVLDVPVSTGARIVGLCHGTFPGGGWDYSIVLAVTDDGGCYAYTST